MPISNIGLFARIKLSIHGKKYYQAELLPLRVLKRYGFEQYYSKSQIQFSAGELGFMRYFDEEIALALLGTPEDSSSIKEYERIRREYGLQNGGAPEVLKVYAGVEKVDSDPFGSHRASETTGGAN